MSYNARAIHSGLEAFTVSTKQVLIREIEALPPQIIEEVYNFVSFLKIRKTQGSDTGSTLFASESALAADWRLPEEDAAWADL